MRKSKKDDSITKDIEQPSNVQFFFKHPPNLEELTEWVTSDKLALPYKIAEFIKCCQNVSMCANKSAVLVEFDQTHTNEALMFEELIYCLKRFGQLLDVKKAREESRNLISQ